MNQVPVGVDNESSELNEPQKVTKVNVDYVVESDADKDNAENVMEMLDITSNKKKKSIASCRKTNKLREMTIEQLASLHPTGGGTLDAWARFAFPFAFAVLNLFYWIMFLYTIDDEIDVDNFESKIVT